jgi:hypothetical protein
MPKRTRRKSPRRTPRPPAPLALAPPPPPPPSLPDRSSSQKVLALAILDERGHALFEIKVSLKAVTLMLLFASTTIASAYEAFRRSR